MTIIGAALILVLGEVLARVVVRWQWHPTKLYVMTHHVSTSGRYTSHPFLPYVLTPNYASNYHNSYGFKGKEFSIVKKGGVKRVVVVGGSTTYGPEKPYGVFLEEMLNAKGVPSEVLNAGVPGWVSMESLVNLQLRVLPLEPDLVIVYQGRNDLLPQGYNNFKADYTHYKKADYSFRYTNYFYKPSFRVSNLFMVLSRFQGDRFGWSSTEEHPIYGTVRWENKPTAEELKRNLEKPEPTEAYRKILASMAKLVQGGGPHCIRHHGFPAGAYTDQRHSDGRTSHF